MMVLLPGWRKDRCFPSAEANDEDSDEESSSRVSLLQTPLAIPDSSNADGQSRCLPFHYFRVGSRQRMVVQAAGLISAVMILVAIGIGVGGGTAYSDSIPKIYVSLLAIVALLLRGALAYYGFLICSRMRRVRSESVSSEMWKVGGLWVVSPPCFTTSSVVALLPDSPAGSSVPSAFLLWVMRELPATSTNLFQRPRRAGDYHFLN